MYCICTVYKWKYTLIINPNDITTLLVRTCKWHNSIIPNIWSCFKWIYVLTRYQFSAENSQCVPFRHIQLVCHIGTQLKQCMCTKMLIKCSEQNYLCVYVPRFWRFKFTNFDVAFWEWWQWKMRALFPDVSHKCPLNFIKFGVFWKLRLCYVWKCASTCNKYSQCDGNHKEKLVLEISNW